MAGNYWIDWSAPLTPQVRKVDHTMADPPRHTYTFNEAREEVADRLYSNVHHLHRELEKVRRMRAADVE